jgi:hypothetical protein
MACLNARLSLAARKAFISWAVASLGSFRRAATENAANYRGYAAIIGRAAQRLGYGYLRRETTLFWTDLPKMGDIRFAKSRVG